MSIRVLCGDARTVLATLPDASVQCCVTSPPYYGLREYGTATWEGGDPACSHIVGEIRTGLGLAVLGERFRGGSKKQGSVGSLFARGQCPNCGAVRIDQQIGLEPSPAEYVTAMVEVFREVRRVLRDDGTCWLNLGDSYNNFRSQKGPGQAVHGRDDLRGKPEPLSGGRGWAGLKEKDLVMMPARVAIALQDDGWYLRSDIIWHKPNPMPESVTDRPTSSHEHVFLLAKRPAYYFDAEAVREDVAPSQMGRVRADVIGGTSWAERNQHSEGGRYTTQRVKVPGGWDRGEGAHGTIHRDGRTSAEYQEAEVRAGRNIRNVWTIATSPYPEAHFATFPPELAERCIKAGSRPGETILDPFGGAGTTALVADRLGRDAVLIELNPAYCALAERRIVGDAPLFAQVAAQ